MTCASGSFRGWKGRWPRDAGHLSRTPSRRGQPSRDAQQSAGASDPANASRRSVIRRAGTDLRVLTAAHLQHREMASSPKGRAVKPTYFFCGVCRGQRDDICGMCSGCGGRVAEVRMSAKPKPKSPQCPRCGPRTDAYKLKRGTYHCRKCGAEFSPVEVGFVDSRPDVNAEKREGKP